jgi:hypothetical protein
MYNLIAARNVVVGAVFDSRFYGRSHCSLYFHHFRGTRLMQR